MKRITAYLAVLMLGSLSACGPDPTHPGYEFAPQMYHSKPYEPYTQIVDTTDRDDYNTIPARFSEGNKANAKTPVNGTIPRRDNDLDGSLKDRIMVYSQLDPLSKEGADQLQCPLPNSEEVVAEGKELFNQFCKHCHGAKGMGDGKVADKYAGVPPGYNKGRYKLLSAGSIFHTITYGKGQMWPHGSQIPVEDRWKIVRYVQKLQQQ